MFRFEKLDVWHKAADFAVDVYQATRVFPDAERFGLTAQMRRAVTSVSSNIAEGAGRGSDAEFARFLEIAYGSLMEVVSQAMAAHRLTFLDQANLGLLYARAEELARMLSGLRQSIKK